MKRFSSIIFGVCFIFALSGCYTYETVKKPVYKNKKVPIYVDIETVDYETVPSKTFEGTLGKYNEPIKIAFIGAFANDIFNEINYFKLLGKLQSDENIHRRFKIIKREEIEKIINFHDLNINSLSNTNLINSLYQKGVKFTFAAYQLPSDDIRIEIVRNSNDEMVFSGVFKNSSESTAMNDIGILFSDNKRAIYSKEKIIDRYKETREIVDYNIYTRKVEDKKKTSQAYTWGLVLGLIGIIVLANI
jgi:hypothetical protein